MNIEPNLQGSAPHSIEASLAYCEMNGYVHEYGTDGGHIRFGFLRNDVVKSINYCIV